MIQKSCWVLKPVSWAFAVLCWKVCVYVPEDFVFTGGGRHVSQPHGLDPPDSSVEFPRQEYWRILEQLTHIHTNHQGSQTSVRFCSPNLDFQWGVSVYRCQIQKFLNTFKIFLQLKQYFPGGGPVVNAGGSIWISGWGTKICARIHAQSCLSLCNNMDCSLPGFSIHGIL